MSNLPSELKYTKDHEWLQIEGGIAKIGITAHAQESLGDITFIELPAVGSHYAQGDTFGVVESVKAASDLYMPIAGEVVEVNAALEDAPETVNDDPYAGGWMIQIKPDNAADAESLLSADAYAELI